MIQFSIPDVICVNFKGGSQGGEHIMRVAGLEKLIMGLSGKDAAIKRVLVEDAAAEPFTQRLKGTVTKSFILGDPNDPAVTLGPVISDSVAGYVQGLIDEALGKGARVVCGNRRRGRYIEATALDTVNDTMGQVSFQGKATPPCP